MSGSDVLILRAMSHSQNAQPSLQNFLPTTTVYAQVLHYYAVDKFAIRHLLDLCRAVDMSDEVGRKNLEGVLRSDFLLNRETDEKVIPSAVRALRRVLLDGDDTLRIVLEILRNEVLKYADDEVEKETTPTEIEGWRQSRALSICLEMLRIAPQQKTNAAASTTLCLSILQTAALPHIMSEDEYKRKEAFECVALYCLLDQSGDEARSKMPLFIQACRNDLPMIQNFAMQALVDFLMMFRFVDDTEVESTSTPRRMSGARRKVKATASLVEEVIEILSEGLTSADEKTRTIAVQGTSRLLFLRRITPTAKLLSRMLITFHNPITEDDDLLRQYLSLFFPSFCMASAMNRIVLEDAFKPTCNVLLSAPESSPLASVDVVHVAQFILHLTNPSLVPQGEQVESIGRPADLAHERLAETVLNELITSCEDGDQEVCRTYSKILSSFRPQWKREKHEYMIIIRRLTKTAYGECDDRRAKNLIKKFHDRMESALEKADEVVPDSREFNTQDGDNRDAYPTGDFSEASTTLADAENSQDQKKIVTRESNAAPGHDSLQNSFIEKKKERGKASKKPRKKPALRTANVEVDTIVDAENHSDPNFVLDVDNASHPLAAPTAIRKYPKRSRKKIIDFIEID
eukprot:gb/GEZJ01005306.1/.p1 GENE.gb/GEZJ01005306.1/~~gb/GEZJ01005306.1/.p1  ORF type:complete len:727 (-),score=125.24 gb/GEZJ01005306.1/:32-1924(-)